MNARSSFSPFASSAIRLSPKARMGFGFDLPDIHLPDFSLPPGPLPPPPMPGAPPAPPPAAPPAPPPAAPPAPPGMEAPVASQWQSPNYVYPEGPLPQERAYPNEPVPAPATAPAPSTGVDTKDLLIGGAVLVALVAILS